MYKFLACVMAVCLCVSSACAEVEQDTELHRVIGGIYSLASAVNISGSTSPSAHQLRKFFEDVPANWQEVVKVERVKNAVWVGVLVGKYSSARQFLRSNSKALGIMNKPGGSAWFGGEYAWLKAADIVNGRLVPVKIFAAAGEDDNIFFSNEAKNFWWEANPDFTEKYEASLLEKFGTEQAGLRMPSAGARQSIYDVVKPSSVGAPGKMHVGTRKSSFDMSIPIGDVMFNPIPNTRI